MLNSVQISNLTCFDESPTTIQFKPLTILVGPNNAGKSSIINAVDYVKEVLSTVQPTNTGRYLNPRILTNWADLIHCHENHRTGVIKAGFQYTSNNFENRKFDVKFSLTSGQLEVETHSSEKNTAVGVIRQLVSNVVLKSQANSMQELTSQMNEKVWFIAPQRSQLASNVQLVQGPSLSQPLDPHGSNVIQYYLHQFTDQNPQFREAQEWISKVDPTIKLVKTPFDIAHVSTSLLTNTQIGDRQAEINFAFMGMGIQNIATLVGGLIFSPPGCTLLIEEPENHLHPMAQEVLVDLMNHEVLNHSKQIVFTTHSWDMSEPYFSDVGRGSRRGNQHVKMSPEHFQMLSVRRTNGGPPAVQEFNLDRPFNEVKNEFKGLIG